MSAALGQDAAYVRRVDARLCSVHAQGVANLAALQRGALGADPWLVHQRARALGLTVDESAAPFEPTAYIPELHPLRCEWYFTPACAQRLATAWGPHLACLGAPTVAAAADCPLFDRDPALLKQRFGERLRDARALDLGRAQSLATTEPFDAAVVDPPWYAPHPRRWFQLAVRAVAPGGVVAMVTPPALQRPSAMAQRASLLAWARRAGPSEIQAGAVVYQTPAFEQIAMRAAAVPVGADWRVADLLTTRVAHPEALGPLPPPVADPNPTETFVIGAQVVTLSGRDAPGPAALHPIAGTRDFVWDRVSLRDPRIATIDLWTSRSRVASVRGRAKIADALVALQAGASLTAALHPGPLRDTLARILAAPPR